LSMGIPSHSQQFLFAKIVTQTHAITVSLSLILKKFPPFLSEGT
jgi:hypothetical protein